MKIDKTAVRVEYSQLNSRIDSLKSSIFNAENGIDSSTEEEITMANLQLKYMELYKKALLSRCSIYKISI